MPTPTPRSDPAPERFAIAASRERWLELAELEHETLLPAADYAFAADPSGDALLVRRESVAGRPLAGGRIPRPARAALLLQAAASTAFFAARGFPLASEDFAAAAWEGDGGAARLWLTRTPHSVWGPAAKEPGGCPSGALVAVIRMIFGGESGRLSPAGARELAASLEAPDAPWKRGEHWVASVFRGFPDLAAAPAAPARERCLGFAGDALRSLRARALTRRAQAILRGHAPRVFEPGPSSLTPGGALRLAPAPASVSDAARRLRDLAASRDERPVTWIAVDPEAWDSFSRDAFEAARLALGDRVAVLVVPASVPLPESPAEWRRAVSLPCGSLAASVRLYETFSSMAPRDAMRTRARLRRLVADPAWAAFASDPTGDAPLPAIGESAAAVAPVERATATSDPGLRIERHLEEGQTAAAFREAERWVAAFPGRPAEAWFPLAARLAAASPQEERSPAWLEAIEAEREIAGGRPAEAKARLERLARALDADAVLRRRARLRAAEVAVLQGQPSEAARRAAEWRRMHPEAPASESVRALRLGAAGFSREGRVDCALALLDEADRIGTGLGAGEKLDNALARARVFALAGRFDEETAVYDSVRADVLGDPDERMAGRFLAQEARGLLDRREPARAIVRLEEAIGAFASDPAERAELALDLAAALYHSVRAEESEAALDRAFEAASRAGRQDLMRIARGNRVELLVNRGAWDSAAAEIAALETSARAEKDPARLLVALHHRSRLALRRGFLPDAARDNAEARRIAEEIADRLEIGELWLEEGDRLLYAGDAEGAVACWERAATRPSDRCDRERTARERLAEAAWRETGGPPEEAWTAVADLFERDPYRAAETVARWQLLFGAARIPLRFRERAARCLRDCGGAELAARVFGPAEAEARTESLRPLRDALRAALGGETPNLDGTLRRLGIDGLAVHDGGGRTVVGLGAAPAPERALRRSLHAGAARFELAVWPPPRPDLVDAVTLLLETLLFQPAGAADSPDERPDHVQAWRRLGIVTGDASMAEPYARLARFAPRDVTVMVLGESGSGKEAVARAIHRLSPRSPAPFVAVNVAAIPQGVLESELFGHARGAFSGADRERRGLLEEAAGGTIFLDEIGDLDLALQVKLLRALQEREVRRVGENRARSIDVRVVSATSRDLAREVEAGRFREDLFYRLHVAVVRLPPLRERGRDALLLARHFLERYGREYGKDALTLAPETAAAIGAHAWPGNVRELQNAMAQAAALGDAGSPVTPEMLPEAVRPARPAAVRTGGYRARVDAHRRDLIADALDRAGGNRSRAARELGLSRQALLYLIKELKVEVRKS